MAKLTPLAARQEFIRPYAPAKLIGLLRITPVGETEPIYLCTDATTRLSVKPLRYGAISRGQTYQALAIRLMLPGSSKDELPGTTLETDNIDPSLIQAIQSTPFRSPIDLEIVLSTRPDEVVETWPKMEVLRSSFDDDVVTLTIGYPDLSEEPAVMHRMTVNVFPALRGQ